jgi:hypothetical protein
MTGDCLFRAGLRRIFGDYLGTKATKKNYKSTDNSKAKTRKPLQLQGYKKSPKGTKSKNANS